MTTKKLDSAMNGIRGAFTLAFRGASPEERAHLEELCDYVENRARTGLAVQCLPSDYKIVVYSNYDTENKALEDDFSFATELGAKAFASRFGDDIIKSPELTLVMETVKEVTHEHGIVRVIPAKGE